MKAKPPTKSHEREAASLHILPPQSPLGLVPSGFLSSAHRGVAQLRAALHIVDKTCSLDEAEVGAMVEAQVALDAVVIGEPIPPQPSRRQSPRSQSLRPYPAIPNWRLRLLMELLGIGNNELAAACGLDKGFMSRILNGKVNPKPKYRARIAAYLEQQLRRVRLDSSQLFD